jgi:hypothetical protein
MDNMQDTDCPKKKLKGEIYMKAKGDCPDQVLSFQIVLGTVGGGGGVGSRTMLAVAKGTQKKVKQKGYYQVQVP